MKRRASKLKNLKILTGVDATLDVIKEQNPHLVVNATGSVPSFLRLKGCMKTLRMRRLAYTLFWT